MKTAMNAEQWQQVEAIFCQVIEAPSSTRQALAAQLTGKDVGLLKEVLSLLRAAGRADEFLEDSHAVCTSLTEVIAGWQPAGDPGSSSRATSNPSSDPSSDTGPNADLMTEVDTSPEVAAALSLPVRATLDTVRDFFSKYRPDLQIMDQVGEGAAGIVVKAIDKKLDRFVAIKVLHREWASRLGGDALSREAVSASLSSDHVVRVYEVSSNQSPMLFILMEWIAGPSLREHLSQRSALNAHEAARITIQIASGLAAAQRRSVVHGDIKPANVMLEPLSNTSMTDVVPLVADPLEHSPEIQVQRLDSACYRAKLTDFGLARRVASGPKKSFETSTSFDENHVGGFAGTPAYASPEQLLHRQSASPLSDVWAVGATLYHMLCGVPPYTGRPHAIVRQMRQTPPIPPRQLDPRIPRDLESICMKALNNAASQRYQSAQELVDDLNRFLNGLPVIARPVRWPGKLLRLVKRRPLITSLLVSLFLALLVGSFVSNYFRMRAEGNLAVATQNSQIATEERDNALAVINLLKSMIASGDAHYGNPDIKVIEALEALETRLDSELRSKPRIEAEVRSSLGSMYFSVAAYDSAYAQFRKAIELRGPQSSDSAQVFDRIELANTLRWLYRPEEALDAAYEAVAQAEDTLGKDHATTIYGREVLAGCYKDMGRLDEAANLLEKMIRDSSSSEQSLAARSGLASVLIDQGKNAEAEVLIRESMALRQELGLNDTRESLVLESNLGTALAEQGKVDAAIEVQKACAERATKLLGHTHDVALTAWLNYSETLRRHGEIEQSLAINQQLWNACQKELGVAHSKTLDCAEAVILIQIRQKRFAEALQLVDLTVKEVTPDLMPSDDWHQKFAGMRSAVLTGLGRAEEAVTTYEQVVQHFETKLGSQGTQVLVHKNNFGLTLIEAGQYQRAENLYREIIAAAAALELPSVERNLKRNLGLALLRSGQHQAARELLEAVYRDSLAAGEVDNATKCQEYLSLLQ